MTIKQPAYTPASDTNVQRTWARFGWVPRETKTAGAYPCPACVGLRRHDTPHTCKSAGQYVER